MQDKKQSLVPELRFPGFEGDWEVKSLGEIGSTYAGLSGKSKEDFVNGNAQYITFLNVLNNVVIDNTNHPTVKIKENENQNDVKYGDLLFNTSSETPEEVGFCAMMQDNKPNIYLNSFCFGYRFNVLKDYQPLFLAYYFRSSYGRRLMTKLAQGVTRYNLSKSNFLKAEIAFPSLPEQQKIAECLSSVDNLIQAEADQLQALKDHKKGLMQQLFPQEGETTPKLRFPGFEGEWEVKKLGEILDYEQPTPYLVSSDSYQKDGTPVLTAGKTFILGYTDETFGIYNKVPVIIFDDFVTESKYVTFPFKAKSSAMKMLSLKDNSDNLYFAYISMLLNQKPIGDHKRHWISETSQIFVTVPPTKAEQQKIAECLSSLDEGIAAQQEKVEALREHKKGLMQKLFPTIN